MVRMAYLSVVGSTKVNGVAALHTQLLKKNLFSTFHKLYPDKLINMPKGITPRRWLFDCNPAMSELITDKVGDEWLKNLDLLHTISELADDISKASLIVVDAFSMSCNLKACITAKSLKSKIV